MHRHVLSHDSPFRSVPRRCSGYVALMLLYTKTVHALFDFGGHVDTTVVARIYGSPRVLAGRGYRSSCAGRTSPKDIPRLEGKGALFKYTGYIVKGVTSITRSRDTD